MDEKTGQKSSQKWCEKKAWINLNTGQKAPFNCMSWSCPKCAPKIREKWVEILNRSIIARYDKVRFITLTKVGETPEEAKENYKQFVKALRRKDYEYYYFKVHESGEKTGMSHYHILQCGDYLPQELLSKIAESNNMGKIVHISQVKIQEASLRYVTKYMAKLSGDWEGRKLSYSQQFFAGKKTKEIWEEVKQDWYGEKSPDPWGLLDKQTGGVSAGKSVPADVWERYKLSQKREENQFYGDGIEE